MFVPAAGQLVGRPRPLIPLMQKPTQRTQV